jgi:PII-like signaling protein
MSSFSLKELVFQLVLVPVERFGVLLAFRKWEYKQVVVELLVRAVPLVGVAGQVRQVVKVHQVEVAVLVLRVPVVVEVVEGYLIFQVMVELVVDVVKEEHLELQTKVAKGVPVAQMLYYTLLLQTVFQSVSVYLLMLVLFGRQNHSFPLLHLC